MNIQDVLKQARENMDLGLCHSCPECNGKACRNAVPGPGAKGDGLGAIRNAQAWKEIGLVLDTLAANEPVSTKTTLFGQSFELPVFAGPVGAVDMHYGTAYIDQTYNEILLRACKNEGILAFTGDGMNPDIMKDSTAKIKENGGVGIPTVKPWSRDVFFEKLQMALACGAPAVAMDIDAAGLPFLKGFQPPAGRKSVAELKEIIDACPVPFIVKGIMSVKGALKAQEAGASAIIVSNHGGRVLEGTPATAKVLEEIVRAVKPEMTVLVDGGIRTGQDVFKALALGADGVLIARPFVNMIYGAQDEGVSVLVNKLKNELVDTMEMCGAHSVDEISRDMICTL